MLNLQSISFSVAGGSRTKILDQISLQIKPNTTTVITGPNGSGKSTLAEIIMGIKTPTEGRVFFGNKDITHSSITDRAKLGIAYAFQEPVKLKGITIYELLNIASGELISPEDATTLLQKVGLSQDYLTREMDDRLSGGELKRIELATVLARSAKLIIFDEPEAGIDLWSFDNLTKVFQNLKTLQTTIIIISHQERILRLTDEIIILENGKIKSQGSPATILPKIKGAKQ